jgi:hypothetical protein
MLSLIMYYPSKLFLFILLYFSDAVLYKLTASFNKNHSSGYAMVEGPALSYPRHYTPIFINIVFLTVLGLLVLTSNCRVQQFFPCK